MAGASERKDVKSSQEVEEEIKSISTVTWDPFTLFPKEIYVKIFDKLDSPTDKKNFMNAHHKFYSLFESKRTLILFEDVFKNLAKREKEQQFKKYQECRLVCHDWDNGTQKFFQLNDSLFMIEEEKDIWVDFPLTVKRIKVPCKDFHWRNGDALEKDLEIFSVTHPPSKNPLFSRNLNFEITDWNLIDEGSYWTSVDALLEMYGQHIWHCRIDILKMFLEEPNREPLSCIAKWLNLMPALKTLEIHNEDQLSKNADGLQRLQDIQVVQPELKNLVFLKSYDLQAVAYNKLFGNLKGLEKIEVVFSNGGEFLRNFAVGERESLKEAFFNVKGYEDFKYLEESGPFPNLKKLVTRLAFRSSLAWSGQEKAYLVWPEWRMIFKIMEEKFPSLEELNLRLPKAVSVEHKRAAMNQTLECQLNLPKLKKLWVYVPNLCSLDFLSPCNALVELRVILEHSEWCLEGSVNLKRIRRDEKTNFNMDFSNMWESNIWKAFPNLRKLRIWAWRDSCKSIDRYRYEKIGQDRMFDQKAFAKAKGGVNVFSDSD